MVVDKRHKIWRARHFGGLSNFWGSVVLPFTDKEFSGWPVTAADMAPYYRRISEVMGISGTVDGLNKYFGDTFENRPPIELPLVMKSFLNIFNDSQKFVAGHSRLALETRLNNQQACNRCGQCLSGCPVDAIFRTENHIQKLIPKFTSSEIVRQKVMQYDPVLRVIEMENGLISEQFDRIYLAAGCLGTTEIVMRSLGLSSGPVMTDNTIFTFPIIYTGRNSAVIGENHMAMTYLLMGYLPDTAETPFTKIQIYSSFDYLWQYILPPKFWFLFKPIGQLLRARILWARLYLDGTESDQYALQLDNELKLSVYQKGKKTDNTLTVFRELRKAIKKTGFVIPRLPLIRHKTSSHYTATLPYGSVLSTREGALTIDRVGTVADGVHICDGAVFASSPSNSPTFTIMANAYRTVMDSLNG
ncbi:MAG: hypothetical protein CMF69_09845 [Magnetovibrio sp.]|nr:hypothetical protein [Magnetovibrio sp.]